MLTAAAVCRTVSHAGAATQANMYIDVYQTSSSYVAAYHYLQCSADSMPMPTTTAEVASIVSYYYSKAAAGQPVTLRASRPKFHITATFVCPTALPQTKPAAVSQEQAPRTVKPLEVAILHIKLNKVGVHCAGIRISACTCFVCARSSVRQATALSTVMTRYLTSLGFKNKLWPAACKCPH
jgi:hypothetical protein